jgi:hypothetical protein
LGASAKEFRKGVSEGKDDAEEQSTEMAASDAPPAPDAPAADAPTPATPPPDTNNQG